ncbi:hypothetical protein H6P81_017977 [Aristolochia fimbriata]|uniref:Uncharacterized protein n=1 Tax=Aristolochia fimbriata TaxID=158543 RepID=A0AAV7E0G6_ARIFI|nr:hypothetical protein H6P81_017977 [Aristolochia fimbriata]
MSTYPSFASCLDLLALTYSTGFSPFPTKNITECLFPSACLDKEANSSSCRSWSCFGTVIYQFVTCSISPSEGRGVGLERKTPPQGYICHRCKVPGIVYTFEATIWLTSHFIQHCPTNGDPNYDIKRVKLPTGIPKSMLMATPEGSYVLPSRVVAVLRPNEYAVFFFFWVPL